MKQILVIGSVHLDIVATIRSETRANVDKTGTLSYSIGGSAFNVAANLRYHKRPVTLHTFIRRGSLSGDQIKRELTKRRISDRFVRSADLPESGFVAHVNQDHELVSAVSCTGIEDVSLDQGLLATLISRADLVALECNLSTDQIALITTAAAKLQKPVAINCVSESRVERISRRANVLGPRAFRIATMNVLEAKRVFGKDALATDPGQLCAAISAQAVVVTLGGGGFNLYQEDGVTRQFETPISHIKSSLGAGDALFSAVCAHVADNGTVDPKTLVNDIKRYLQPVLQSNYATPEVAPSILDRLRAASQEFAMSIAMLAFLLALICAIYGWLGHGFTSLQLGFLIIATPLLGGISGSIVGDVLVGDASEGLLGVRTIVVSVMGAIAGALSGLFYLLPQLMGNGKFAVDGQLNLVTAPFLLPFCLVVGVISGLSAEALLRKLRGLQPVKVEVPAIK